MAHNIEQRRGKKASFFNANGQHAWHGLGTIVDKAVTAEEAMNLANLNYIVEKQELRTPSGIIAPKYATVRTDTNLVLGVVGEDYTVMQNKDAFSFFDALTLGKEAMYETAGVLGKGERVWILAKLPDYIRVGKNDVIEKYVLIANSHDGTLAITVMLTPVRVVCNNTLNAALSSRETKISIMHFSNAEEKLKKAHEVLGLYDKRAKDIEVVFNAISKKAASDAWVKKTLATLVPLPLTKKGDKKDTAGQKAAVTRAENIRTEMFKYYNTGIGQADIVGNRWGFYNGITGFVDHGKYETVEQSFKNSMFGKGEVFKLEALKLCLA